MNSFLFGMNDFCSVLTKMIFIIVGAAREESSRQSIRSYHVACINTNIRLDVEAMELGIA